MAIINVTQILAEEKIHEIIKLMECCTCEKCEDDVMAIALNTLKPKYVTTHAGKQYVQLESFKKQIETDVTAALMRACMTVKEHPSH